MKKEATDKYGSRRALSQLIEDLYRDHPSMPSEKQILNPMLEKRLGDLFPKATEEEKELAKRFDLLPKTLEMQEKKAHHLKTYVRSLNAEKMKREKQLNAAMKVHGVDFINALVVPN